MQRKWCALFLFIFLLLPFAALSSAEELYVNNPMPTDRLHLRKGASSVAASQGRYYNGTIVSVLGVQGEWTKVRIGDGDGAAVGFMLTSFLSTTPSESALHTAQVYSLSGENTSTLYALPEKNASPVAQLKDFSTPLVLADLDTGWVHVFDQATNAYGYLRAQDFIPFPFDVALTSRYNYEYAGVYHTGTHMRAHLRTRPVKDAPSLGEYYNSTALRVYAFQDNWAFVGIENYDDMPTVFGYMDARYVSLSHFPYSTAPYAWLKTTAPVLSKPYAGASATGTLSQKARVIVGAQCGDYLLVNLPSSSNHLGYVHKDALDISTVLVNDWGTGTYGAQGLAIVRPRDGGEHLRAYAACDADHPINSVNSNGANAEAYVRGQSLIVLHNLGDFTQVYDGYNAPFVPTKDLTLFDTGDFYTPLPYSLTHGTHRVGASTLPAGFYSYFVPNGKTGSIEIVGAQYRHSYAPIGLAFYNFYLEEGAQVTLGGTGTLTAFDDTRHESPYSSGYASGRYIVGIHMRADNFWAKPLEGAEESYIVITNFEDDLGGATKTKIDILPLADDAFEVQFFHPNTGDFVEFVGCVIGTNG